MRILLTGGSAGGKSTYAGELAKSFPAPFDPKENDARVQTGRLCILLAQRARKVIRLVSGIPVVLKDGRSL